MPGSRVDRRAPMKTSRRISQREWQGAAGVPALMKIAGASCLLLVLGVSSWALAQDAGDAPNATAPRARAGKRHARLLGQADTALQAGDLDAAQSRYEEIYR